MPSALRTFTPALDREVAEELAVEWQVKSARRLRLRRERHPLKPTQADLGHACGVTGAHIGAVERGIALPSEPLRWLIAYNLNCEVDEIWEPMSRRELRDRCANLVDGAA